jgi:predicted secreted hydrolase
MKRLIVIVLVVAFLVAVYLVVNRQPTTTMRAQLVAPTNSLLNYRTNELSNFALADGPRPLVFPADHGPHDDFQTEWWYYTGNVQTPDGRHFGYQLTFFRRALVSPAERQVRSSGWATDQVYMAHFALTDVATNVVGKRFQSFERFERGAAGLAGAQASPLKVWLDDWRVEQVEPNVYRLRASQGDLALDLQLQDRKGPVLQGDQGYSQKGPDPGNASYYYSLTRLETSGTMRVGDASYQVNGSSWMDHEWSTSYLTGNQVGWDWFALQLSDGPSGEGGSELMMFQIRKADGSVDPLASGTLVAPDGTTRRLSRDDLQIAVGATWRSPRSGATYPAAWTIKIPSAGLTLDIKPYLADQELDVSFTYWEGSVQISGAHAGRAVSGSGYIEMTGYAGSMGGQF